MFPPANTEQTTSCPVAVRSPVSDLQCPNLFFHSAHCSFWPFCLPLPRACKETLHAFAPPQVSQRSTGVKQNVRISQICTTIVWNSIRVVLGVFLWYVSRWQHIYILLNAFLYVMASCKDLYFVKLYFVWVLCSTQSSTSLCSFIFCGMCKGWYQSRIDISHRITLRALEKVCSRVLGSSFACENRNKFTFRSSQSLICLIPYRTKSECYCVSIWKVVLESLTSNTWSLLWDKAAKT